MHRIAVKPMTGWIEPGAARRPQSPVKTTRLITRGLVSAKKSRHSAGRGRTSDGLWTVAVIANSNPLPSENGRGMDTNSVGRLPRSRSDGIMVRVVVLDHRQRLELVVR